MRRGPSVAVICSWQRDAGGSVPRQALGAMALATSSYPVRQLPPVQGSPRGSPRSPRTLASLALSPRPSTTSAAVRGGGRLFVQSPLCEYSEAEMIKEAQLRISHNKQRQRLKNILRTAADGGAVVETPDLMLACQLAKVDLKQEKVVGSPFAVVSWRLAPSRRSLAIAPPSRSRARCAVACPMQPAQHTPRTPVRRDSSRCALAVWRGVLPRRAL